MWKKCTSFPRVEITKDGKIRAWNNSWGRYVDKKPRLDKDGYEIISIRDEKGRSTSARVHRLVAEVYISNPDNKPLVNHINGIKDDNRVENLEWSTVSENTKHGYDSLGVLSATSKPVVLIIDGKPYSKYQSITRMSEIIGINRNTYMDFESISNGYFRFIENYDDDDDDEHEDSDIGYNKEVWKDNFRLNKIGNFYKCDGVYYNKVKTLMELFKRDKSTIHRWIKEGHPRGMEIKVVSCEEFLRNTHYRNW